MVQIEQVRPLRQSGPGNNANEEVLLFPKGLVLQEPHHKMVLCHIPDVEAVCVWGGSYLSIAPAD